MQELTTSNVAVALYNPQPGSNPVAIRRAMLDLPVVKKSLTTVEMSIFQASIGRTFDSYGDVEMVNEAKVIFDFVAMDVGYNKPDNMIWGQAIIRFVSILKMYYSTFTFNDVIKAFEMLAVGRLDAYLPKDSNGNPDKKHYQQFNIEYLSKVLNAYGRERCRVIQKAQRAVPRPERKMTPEQCRYYRNFSLRDLIQSFLLYKYTGRFNCGSSIGEMLAYNELAKYGFVEEMEITMDDQRAMLGSAMTKRPNFTNVKKMRRRLLKKAFDEMIADEIQITEYLKFE